MASSTTEFAIKREDGWTLAASNVTFLHIEPSSSKGWALAFTASGEPADSAQADLDLVFTGNPSNTQTLTLDGVAYRAVTAFDATAPGARDFVIGATAEATIDNIVAIVNGRAAIPAVAAEGTITITSTGPAAAETFTIGAQTFTFVAAYTGANDEVLTNATPANVVTGIVSAVNGRKAFGTVTFSGGVPAAGETVTVGTITYKFVVSPALPAAPNDVLVGADETATAANLAAAINAGAGAGTVYGTGTVANSAARATSALGVVTVTAISSNATVGNDVFLTEAAANTAVSGSGTLFGGTNASTAVTAVANSAVAELTAIAPGVAGNLIVLTETATETAVSGSGTLAGGTNAVPAVDANPRVLATKAGTDTITFAARAAGVAGNSIAVVETLSNAAFAGGATALAGGADAIQGVSLGNGRATFFRAEAAITGAVYVRVTTDDSIDPVKFSVLAETA